MNSPTRYKQLFVVLWLALFTLGWHVVPHASPHLITIHAAGPQANTIAAGLVATVPDCDPQEEIASFLKRLGDSAPLVTYLTGQASLDLDAYGRVNLEHPVIRVSDTTPCAMLTGVLSHEYGHVLQSRAGLRAATYIANSARYELQADCVERLITPSNRPLFTPYYTVKNRTYQQYTCPRYTHPEQLTTVDVNAPHEDY